MRVSITACYCYELHRLLNVANSNYSRYISKTNICTICVYIYIYI